MTFEVWHFILCCVAIDADVLMTCHVYWLSFYYFSMLMCWWLSSTCIVLMWLICEIYVISCGYKERGFLVIIFPISTFFFLLPCVHHVGIIAVPCWDPVHVDTYNLSLLVIHHLLCYISYFWCHFFLHYVPLHRCLIWFYPHGHI